MSLNNEFTNWASKCRNRRKKEVVLGPNVTLILGQQTFTSTSFSFAHKQSLVTALLCYKLSTALLQTEHSIHVKSTLHQ